MRGMLTQDTWRIETHGLVLTRKSAFLLIWYNISLSIRLFNFKPHLYKLFPSPQMADEDDPTLSEMEAAHALAALARCSAVRAAAESTRPYSQMKLSPTLMINTIQDTNGYPIFSAGLEQYVCLYQDQEVAAFHENKYRMDAGALICGVTNRNVPSKLCPKSNRLNSATRLRQNMTEDEKEKRRLQRILANRESAWKTIRLRQAMHQELMRKAVDLSKENEMLKKEKDLAMEEYNSVKGRNKFLKLQMANAKKAEPREIKVEPKSSKANKPTSATISSPVFLYNQPSLVPFFVPSVPSSNAVHLQYLSHSDVMSLSEFSRHSVGITGPENSLFVFPLPWAVPFPSYGTMLHSHSDTRKRQIGTPSSHQCSMPLTSDNLYMAENNELSSKSNILTKDASSCTRSTPVGRIIGAGFTYPVNHCDHNISNPYAASATNNCHSKPVNMFASTKARRRRKELIMLKNVQYHRPCIHSANL